MISLLQGGAGGSITGLESRFERKQSEPTLGVTLNHYTPNCAFFTKRSHPRRNKEKENRARKGVLPGGRADLSYHHTSLLHVLGSLSATAPAMPARALGGARHSWAQLVTARGGPGGGVRRGWGRGAARRSAGRVGTWGAGGACRLVLPPIVSKIVCHLHAGLAVGGPLGKSLRRQRLAVS